MCFGWYALLWRQIGLGWVEFVQREKNGIFFVAEALTWVLMIFFPLSRLNEIPDWVDGGS